MPPPVLTVALLAKLAVLLPQPLPLLLPGDLRGEFSGDVGREWPPCFLGDMGFIEVAF